MSRLLPCWRRSGQHIGKETRHARKTLQRYCREALLLRSKIDSLRTRLEALRAKDGEFSSREADLEAAIGEASSEEDRIAVEALVEEFEKEKSAHEAETTRLAGEVEQLEWDLAEEEAKAPAPAPATQPDGASDRSAGHINTREDDFKMPHSIRGFLGMDAQRRDAFLARAEVKDFLLRVRELGGQRRAVTGAELTIPEAMLGLLRENIAEYSKLIGRVNLQQVPGKARQNIMGAVPEAVWTEACASLNGLELGFKQVEVDGYKVGGYIPICNATLEDSDLTLASILLDALGRAIGRAVDKAIIYGTGVKMPTGIITRLAQTAKPSNWPESAPAWADLHTTHIQKLAAKTGTAFFQQIISAAGAADDKYAKGELTFVMNKRTKNKLLVEGLSINATGTIVTGISNTMPAIGGEIVTLDFVPDNDIIFGYLDLYLLAERAGTVLAQSEHVRFLQDQTVFRGAARYDGAPAIGEAFGAMNVAGAEVTTSVTFAPDTANTTTPDAGG